MLVLSQNKTSIRELYFCKFFVENHNGFSPKTSPNMPTIQKTPSVWDGYSYCTRITLRVLPSNKQCRAGGKPSTWFLPGTRRADHMTDD